jgi:hypothetical protein
MSRISGRVVAVLSSVALLCGGTQLIAPSQAAVPPASQDAGAPADFGAVAGLPGLDEPGSVLPTAAQRTAAAALDAQVRWNRFGTPASISPVTGTLGAASGDPVTAAREWLSDHAAVLGLTRAQVADLVLVNDQKLTDSSARAVLFRQEFGGLAPALDGMVTVGVGNGAVQYVSSSLARTGRTPSPALLTPTQGWRTAAADVGEDIALTDVIDVVRKDGWTRLTVTGLAQEQQVRLRALPFPDGSVRPVYVANVVNVAGAEMTAYTVLVDAVTGATLHRQNQVEQSSDSESFQGTITATECGPRHAFELTDGNTRSIVATAAEAVTTNDIVVKLFDPAGQLLVSGDTGTSPEVVTYQAAAIPAGTYSVQVCPFADPTVPFVAPGDYAAGVTTSDAAAPETPSTGAPQWRFFEANPSLDSLDGSSPDNSVVGCWDGADGCTLSTGELRNIAAPGPWDYLVKPGAASLTTVGNNATTHEAWLSPLTPGGLLQAPISPTRDYTKPFTDAWNNARCNPANLVPGGNDIDAVTTNLFAAHNRMHDFAYYLGFTEENYNLQQDNLGRNDDPTRQNDPEVGNVQAGALTGGQPSFLGRDNANQVTLQDGIPGITNQYLFQPIAGAFYAPCADGATDMSIVGHEYTHAISNRMIAGPDEGITSGQGGAMGESWGDLVAAEYLISHGYDTGTNPWAVGPYATGNTEVGIRDYAIDDNPLNYSDIGFDSPGVEVHADGEIWNGTMYEVRQALVEKYDAAYPSSDEALQLRCARATADSTPLPSDQCPGNRRWVQLMFDGFLLQQGATSMLDARDAMLAADRMRYGGANQQVIWDAFARRGMGVDASTPNADSGDPKPGFASPLTKSGQVTFTNRDEVVGKVYIGDYEARATPVADTDPSTELPASVGFAPGTYRVLFVAPGHGMTRSTMTVAAGRRPTVRLQADRNLASAANGASVVAASAGSLNAASLIDDTEATTWAGVNESASVDDQSPFVTIDLAGTEPVKVSSVRVSALLRPATDGDNDPDSGARFTALRSFAIEACASGCSDESAWQRIYTSADDAFPGTAPRPVAPNLTLRSFDVPDTMATQVRLVALENQCTGTPQYAGEQDDDPVNDTDCKAASDADLSVRAAELEVF